MPYLHSNIFFQWPHCTFIWISSDRKTNYPKEKFFAQQVQFKEVVGSVIVQHHSIISRNQQSILDWRAAECCVRHTSSTGHFGCALFMSARGKKEGVTEDKEEVKENKPRLQSARSHDQMG